MGINPRTGAAEIQKIGAAGGSFRPAEEGIYFGDWGHATRLAGLQSDLVWTKVLLVFFRRVS